MKYNFIVTILIVMLVMGCESPSTDPQPGPDKIQQQVGDKTVPPSETANVSGTDKPDTEPPPGMVFIPAGEFEMGSNNAESDNDEQPVRKVYVNAFYMDETEVTNVQFKEFLLENPQWQKGRINSKFANDDYLALWSGNNYRNGAGNDPVTFVSWYAAVAYAEWANKRLLTEAEWEYAARGLESKGIQNGDNVRMVGYLWEWCLDEYDAEFYFTFPRNGVAHNPLSGANSVKWLMDNFTDVKGPRVVRGGVFPFESLEKRVARVTDRIKYPPAKAEANVGFRCVRSYQVRE